MKFIKLELKRGKMSSRIGEYKVEGVAESSGSFNMLSTAYLRMLIFFSISDPTRSGSALWASVHCGKYGE
jgi:hypothetical protein